MTGLCDQAQAVASEVSDAAAWSAQRRRTVLAELDRTIAVLAAARAHVLLAERASGAWRGNGDPTFEAWRGRTSRGGRREAHSEMAQAEVLRTMPAVRAATVGGALSGAHVAALARVARAAAPAVRDVMASVQGQTEILGLARADATVFARSVARWAAEKDPAGLERDHLAQRAGRHLHVVDSAAGTRVTGLLDRMAGHRLRLALEAVSPRPAPGDERTPEQRRADALDTLAGSVLALPGTGPGAAVRPHVSFLMTESAWTALRSARASGSAVPTAPAEPVTLEDGTPVPTSEVAAALCDCALTRIVIDADSLPMDLGRTQRVYTGAQRRAVIARDRHCAWPGCAGNARWCEIHHIRWWDRDEGATSVENGVLLCSFHHHEIHRRDLTIRRVPIARGPCDAAAAPRYLLADPAGRHVAVEQELLSG